MLRDELAELMQQPEAELAEKAEVAGVLEDSLHGPAAFFMAEVVLPQLAAQREAILRLAAKIDELEN